MEHPDILPGGSVSSAEKPIKPPVIVPAIEPEKPSKGGAIKGKARPTAAEMEKRYSIISELLLTGQTYTTICRFVSEKTDWNINTRSIDRYIKKVSKLIRQLATIDRDLELGMAMQRNEDLYRRCHKISDYKTCLAVQRERIKLLGLREKVEKDTNKGLIMEYIDDNMKKPPE